METTPIYHGTFASDRMTKLSAFNGNLCYCSQLLFYVKDFGSMHWSMEEDLYGGIFYISQLVTG